MGIWMYLTICLCASWLLEVKGVMPKLTPLLHYMIIKPASTLAYDPLFPQAHKPRNFFVMPRSICKPLLWISENMTEEWVWCAKTHHAECFRSKCLCCHGSVCVIVYPNIFWDNWGDEESVIILAVILQ